MTHVPAHKVDKVVDSSGAGDAFVGSLAYFLSCSCTLLDSVNLASYVASVSVKFKGTQISYPSKDSLDFGFLHDKF